ncbi:AAA family ATPase [uncultured Dubosiella sp.]|uniref:cytidylate kinase-like family protein n=1 Tax=uncultured Dubosiella sp. TaxID=1937011 RepID=UPI0025B55632|nr:cytidylate kinase-like family protein [uncultured Dubosiella sp.]
MNKIITISREFGSGGREIGKRLADELGFAYYDQEIIKEICKETGMHEGYVEGVAEKAISLISTQFGHTFYNQQQIDVLVSQQKIIQELASKGNCVVVGHGCAEILAERNPFSIFVYADMEAKIKRCRAKGPEEEKLTEKELVRKIKDVDKNRKKIHEMIAPTRWGEKENYDLCVNTTNVEIKKVIPGLAMYAMEYFGKE